MYINEFSAVGWTSPASYHRSFVMMDMLEEVKWWTAGTSFPARCQTDEQFTSEFSVPDNHFHQNSFDCWRSKMFWLQLLQLKRFHHPSIIFLIDNLINEEMMSRLHQSWWILLRLNFSLSSVFCVVIDSIIAGTPTYCITLFSRLGYCITLWLTIFLAD